jgi:hypothetical protein
MPMDENNVKRRNKKQPNHDTYTGDGFVKQIEKEFNPPEGSKKLEYFYIDAHFNDDEKEIIALDESKEQFWEILNQKDSFKTDLVQEVLTEYDSLKKSLEIKENQIAERDRTIQEYAKKDTDRISKENDESQKPIEGFTFLQVRRIEESMKNVHYYKIFIS